ncbi:MAG: hypothetical protein KDC73_04750 [Ignavibacteriae bacterium]|nr:hypothetical protein [Ignavibacteriota bacterium]MCB0723987.1 hypothetical protein [Ignavibacteriota bacterium]MCB9243969.1 hypothetical protein [Ignavibacteriales bacterium]
MKYLPIILFLGASLTLTSCGKEEDGDYKPPQEYSADKEKELQEREEFLRLKEEELRKREQMLDSTGVKTDTSSKEQKKDSVKTEEKKKEEKKEDVQKEKELNTRLDNPKATIDDYLEYIKRGTEGGDFDKNMSEASKLWSNRSVNVFKKNYKDTDKFIIESDPKVISNDNKTAKVMVNLKTVNKSGGEEVMSVTYILEPDSKGKWKIKGNTLVKKQ